MVTLVREPGRKIAVYAADHGVPRRVLVEALGWAAGRQAELLTKWQELNP